MTSARTPVFLRSFALLLMVALAGCASLPPVPQRAESKAITGTRDTLLGRLASASLDGSGPGESGFRLLPAGDFAFDARIALARRAERSLDVQYYQIQRDSIGLQFLRELRDAAGRGVRVRLLVDDLYTAGEDELFRTFAAMPNVEVRLFNPLPSRGTTLAGRLLFSLHEFTRINHRMHNKLFIADNRFSVSGGRNMADEYFMRSAQANFIDMDVIAAGPVVRELSGVFDRYWNSDYAYPVQSVVALQMDTAAAQRRFDELAKNPAPVFESTTGDPFGLATVEFELLAGQLTLTFANASVFADAPEKIVRKDRDENLATVTRSTLEAFAGARSEVIVASPYFIPGPLGLKLLQEAIDHHVRVVVLTNALGATDEPLVHWRYARYRRELLKMGVEIYELSPSLTRDVGNFGDFRKSFGRLHAKVAMIDRHTLFIGSMNLDNRSAWSNTEAGLLIDSVELSQAAYSLFDKDKGASVYRLRLATDGETIEWVSTGRNGKEIVLRDEPDNNWLLRLKMFLLEPFATEELL
jgi:cardiolipin synthase C